MRWSSFLIVAVVAFSLFSCKKAEEKGAVQKEVKLPKMEETFPFSEAEKIEVISYPVRSEWDTIEYKKGKFGVIIAVKDKKLQINPRGIKDRIVLDKKMESKLFELIHAPDQSCDVAACFDPRHTILFYNDKSEIIADLQICFECSNYQFSKGFIHGPFCVGTLFKFFKDAGVTYFGEHIK